MSNNTNVTNFVGELNAGIFVEQLSVVLSEAALAAVINGSGNKKAKVSIDFSFQQIGENDQVIICAKLSKSLPTKRGKKTEENETDTPFFVGKGGQLTIDAPRESLTGQFNLQHEQELPGKVRSIVK